MSGLLKNEVFDVCGEYWRKDNKFEITLPPVKLITHNSQAPLKGRVQKMLDPNVNCSQRTLQLYICKEKCNSSS